MPPWRFQSEFEGQWLGAVDARGKVLVKLNVDANQLESAILNLAVYFAVHTFFADSTVDRTPSRSNRSRVLRSPRGLDAGR